MPNTNIIVGSNGSTVTLQCLTTSTYPITITITWINNGTTLISDQSNILNLTFLLTKEVHEQILTCQAVIDCIALKLEKEAQFNITCKYSYSCFICLLIYKCIHKNKNEK